ncbi:MAG: hypothetical protein QOG37_1508 [Mycobacterium sp.]|jgi:hypothetical protein|nr:hypothetical protein [Mycobacterium sp.]
MSWEQTPQTAWRNRPTLKRTGPGTTLPAYDATVFLSQFAQGNLVDAIELPLASTAGLAALGGMIEFIAVVEAAAEIVQDLQSLSF